MHPLTSCGVVTSTQPSLSGSICRNCTIDRCSSDVPGGVSTIKKSSSPQLTSRSNCLMRPGDSADGAHHHTQLLYRRLDRRQTLPLPFFRGPRHMTASSSSGSMNPIDITPKLSETYTGSHPSAEEWMSLPCKPSMRGMDGPHKSMSSSPTCIHAQTSG